MVAASRPSHTPSAERHAVGFDEPASRDHAPEGRHARSPSVADWAWAAAAAAALLPVTIVELAQAVRTPSDAAWLAASIGLFVVLHLTVALRRRSPRGALLVASVTMLLLTAASLPGTPAIAVLLPSSAAYLVSVFTAASSDDQWADVAAIVLGLLGAALMTAVSIAHGPVPPVGALIALAGFLVASISAAWALGRYRRESRRKRAAQARSLEQAAEIRLQSERAAVADERRRIGGELHDVISHSLAVMVAQAEAARVLLDRDEARARAAIENVVATGRTAMTDMRGLLGVLTDPVASDRSAGTEHLEPSPGLNDLPALIERATAPGRLVTFTQAGAPRTVSPGTALIAYRVVQEALTNTLKHTDPPTTSEVRLDWGTEALVVTVIDDGSPHHPTASPTPGGGIRGMRERVEQVGGTVVSEPDERRGWCTRATLPTAADRHE